MTNIIYYMDIELNKVYKYHITYDRTNTLSVKFPDTVCCICNEIFNRGSKTEWKYNLCFHCGSKLYYWWLKRKDNDKNITKTRLTKRNIELFKTKLHNAIIS